MKLALTANGLLSIWFESAKAALAELGIEYEEDREIPGLKGKHPEFGNIVIEFFVPVQGKTRMEIEADDSGLITEFKKKIPSAYKYISDLVIRQTKAEMAEEKAQCEQVQPEQAEEAAVPQETRKDADVSTEKTFVEPETQADDNLFPDEVQQNEGQRDFLGEENAVLPVKDEEAVEAVPKGKVRYCKNCGGALLNGDKVCPKCGKKKRNGGLIALIIVGAVILIGAIGFAIYYFVASGSSVTNTQTTSTSQQTQTQQQASTPSETTTSPTVVLVTAEQFKQVQLGMTYEQVCAVLGREGTFLEPEAQIQNESGGISTLRTYYWEAQGQEGANVCVTFQDGVAVTTSQFGLQ